MPEGAGTSPPTPTDFADIEGVKRYKFQGFEDVIFGCPLINDIKCKSESGLGDGRTDGLTGPCILMS